MNLQIRTLLFFLTATIYTDLAKPSPRHPCVIRLLCGETRVGISVAECYSMQCGNPFESLTEWRTRQWQKMITIFSSCLKKSSPSLNKAVTGDQFEHHGNRHRPL